MRQSIALYSVCVCVCLCGGLRVENGRENEIMGERKVELSKIENLLDRMQFWKLLPPLLRQTAHDYALALFELH